MNIPFIDLEAQFRRLEAEIPQRIQTVLRHGKFIMGPEVSELEEKLASFVGIKHAISCSSGTDALLLPLMAYHVGPGDAVFTTPFSFIATAEVIALLGATPIFVDIDPLTYNLDPTKLEASIEKIKKENELRPKAIIPVDMFGLPADYDPIMKIAEKNHLFVIEDAAQGFGGTYKNQRAGGLGHVAATSFFPAKPLGGYGDGGAMFTHDDGLAEELRSRRIHGAGKDKYDCVRVGLNARLDTLQAAILLAKLSIFSEELELRQQVANLYTQGLKTLVKTPYIPEGSTSAWAQYSVMSDDRNHIQDTLKKHDIPTAIYYPKPLHLQTAFAFLGYQEGDLPIAEATSKKIFSLPMHPYLEAQTQDQIISTFTSAVLNR